MQVGSVGTSYFQPYVYNTNSLSRASLNKVQGIGDDLLTSKTDFSALTDEQKQNIAFILRDYGMPFPKAEPGRNMSLSSDT